MNYDRRFVNALKPKSNSTKNNFTGFFVFLFLIFVVIALFI